MAPGPRHKSPTIHIFQLGAGFCPGRARRLERAAIRPAPPGVRGQGQLNVWPLRPFDGCSPAMSRPSSLLAPMPWAHHHNGPHQTPFRSSPRNRNGSRRKIIRLSRSGAAHCLVAQHFWRKRSYCKRCHYLVSELLWSWQRVTGVVCLLIFCMFGFFLECHKDVWRWATAPALPFWIIEFKVGTFRYCCFMTHRHNH